MKRIFLYSFILVLICSVVSCNSQTSKPEGTASLKTFKSQSRPNVIIIVIDSLRKDHVGCYGYHRDTTPNIDKFSKDSIVLKNLVSSSSWTTPAIMSLFTGLYPVQHRTVHSTSKLPEGIPTLAMLFKEQGYQTVGIVTNPAVSSIFGFDRGFDLYDDSSYRVENEMKMFTASGKKTEPHTYITSPIVTRHAIKWLEKTRNNKKPFCMYLHYNDPHHSYIPPMDYGMMFDPNYKGTLDGYNIIRNPRIKKGMPEEDLDHLIALYDGEILWTDKHIGKVLEKLKNLDLYDNSIILITSDHGEEFLDHDYISHGKTLYNEVINIPGLIKLPKNRLITIENSQLCSMVDLMLTLLDIAGIGYEIKGIDGISLLSANNKQLKNRKGIFFETRVYGRILIGMMTAKYKVMLALDKNIQEAYDIENDPNEKTTLSLINNKKVSAIIKSMGLPYIRKMKFRKGSAKVVVKDKEILKLLKSLGYH